MDPMVLVSAQESSAVWPPFPTMFFALHLSLQWISQFTEVNWWGCNTWGKLTPLLLAQIQIIMGSNKQRGKLNYSRVGL